MGSNQSYSRSNVQDVFTNQIECKCGNYGRQYKALSCTWEGIPLPKEEKKKVIDGVRERYFKDPISDADIEAHIKKNDRAITFTHDYVEVACQCKHCGGKIRFCFEFFSNAKLKRPGFWNSNSQYVTHIFYHY
jgi:hypothetical protein